MIKYLILQNPGHNRVYYNASVNMALAELQLACNVLKANVQSVEVSELAGVRYLSFDTQYELTEDDLKIISRLSFIFALFKQTKVNSHNLLLPVPIETNTFVDQKISSLLKYQGKTNELFTRMMINVALLSSDFNYSHNVNILDPVAGKGTTLFEASVYGFNAYGVELEQKSVHEAQIFFKKYLETERYKHIADKRMVYGKNKHEAVHINEFVYAQNKNAFKDESHQRKLGIVNGNTLDADKYFKANTFHLIVGDLPYGIAHGNSGEQKGKNITRNPSELLDASLMQWKKVLKKGGTVVVAWNSFVVSRHKLEAVFEEKGFDIMTHEPFENFEHMVDKSIKRDIIVAKNK